MKVLIMGFSGSGKSTLAENMGKKKGLQALHLDTIHWLPGWVEQTKEEKTRILTEYLDTHDEWVIDGNYTRLLLDRRLEESDQIVILMFNRWVCLWRAFRRYLQYRNTSRPSMTQGCKEKLDWDFVKWILKNGRKPESIRKFKDIAEKYPQKTEILTNQRQLTLFYRQQGIQYESEERL